MTVEDIKKNLGRRASAIQKVSDVKDREVNRLSRSGSGRGSVKLVEERETKLIFEENKAVDAEQDFDQLMEQVVVNKA